MDYVELFIYGLDSLIIFTLCFSLPQTRSTSLVRLNAVTRYLQPSSSQSRTPSAQLQPLRDAATHMIFHHLMNILFFVLAFSQDVTLSYNQSVNPCPSAR